MTTATIPSNKNEFISTAPYAWMQLTETVAHYAGIDITYAQQAGMYFIESSTNGSAFDPVRDNVECVRFAIENRICIRPGQLHVEVHPTYYPDVRVSERYDFNDTDVMKAVRLAVARCYIEARKQGLKL